MTLLFAPTRVPLVAQQPRISSTSKPRAPANFSARMSTPRRWRPAHNIDPRLTNVLAALQQWHERTGQHAHYVPSDSHLRRCAVARELRLQSLIVRAGGHRAVQSSLGLRPKESPVRAAKNRELVAIALSLEDTCSRAGRPSPHVDLPDLFTIRKLDPRLGNRIAAFPGRNGYNRLAEYIRSRCLDASQPEPLNPDSKPTGNWGVWTDPQSLRAELLAYQLHPQVLPRLCSLPVELSGAIQRQGGASVFASRQGMVLDKNWVNIVRLARLVRWLSDEVNHEADNEQQISKLSYFSRIHAQCTNPPPFPSAARICEAGLAGDVQRYGGRKALAVRLGFSRVHGIRNLYMGSFSVQFAADVLDFAARQVDVASDGSVAMPVIRSLIANGKGHIANVVETLGGEVEVGRRLGLVPLSALPVLPRVAR